jgi:hypothetical protein
MPHPIVGSRFRDGTWPLCFGTQAWSHRFLFSGLEYLLKTVVAPMYASECRRYAEQCLQLAQQLGPQHRNLLLGWAAEWKKVAEELEELEEQDAQEDQFSNTRRTGN